MNAPVKQLDRYFDPEDLRKPVIRKYYGAVKKLGGFYQARVVDGQVHVSKVALRDAVQEIIHDVGTLNLRRLQFSTFSLGKIAGCITFRLSRWMILHSDSESLLKDRGFLKMNHMIAFALGLEYINVNYADIDSSIRSEILYTLTRRHTNQETLGIVFDTLMQAS